MLIVGSVTLKGVNAGDNTPVAYNTLTLTVKVPSTASPGGGLTDSNGSV